MTTTPAMPELPKTPYSLFYEEPGDIEGEGCQSVLDEPGYTADQMRAYALATLQAQPAEVSDADVWELWLRVCAESDNLSTRVMIANFARAILALRPQAVPMTRDVFGALKKVHETAVYLGAGECSITMDLVREIDAIFERSTAHHNITAPAGGEGEA